MVDATKDSRIKDSAIRLPNKGHCNKDSVVKDFANSIKGLSEQNPE